MEGFGICFEKGERGVVVAKHGMRHRRLGKGEIYVSVRVAGIESRGTWAGEMLSCNLLKIANLLYFLGRG
jgi:hypothetical protein